MVTWNVLQKQHLGFVAVSAALCMMLLLSSCQLPNSAESAQIQMASVGETEAETSSAHTAAAESAAISEEAVNELEISSPIELDPNRGQEIGSVFEAFLSPHQEGGEEEDTPGLTPAVFKSTAPSVARNERQSRGHGVIAFTNDLSKAFVYVAIEGVDVDDIVMFHLHCGRPGQLGPIIVDFSLKGDLQELLADNVMALEITNDDLLAVLDHGEGMIGALTAGCPIVAANPLDKVTTISGLETIARQGEIYFNLHTKGQTFFGDIRGKVREVPQ